MWRKVDYILKNRIDVIQTTILTPLPGTRLFYDFQKNKRLKYTNYPKDWDLYDMGELTFYINKLQNEEFLKTLKIYLNKIYSKWTLYKKFLKTWFHCKSLETALWAYSSNKNYRKVSLNK